MDTHPADSHAVLAALLDYEVIRTTLRLLHRPSKLGETPWSESCLVATWREGSPEKTMSQAVKAVFQVALTQMAEETPDQARLLQARYVEKKTAEKLADTEGGALRTVYYQQKTAIEHLAQILEHRERLCREQQHPVPLSTKLPSAAEDHSSAQIPTGPHIAEEPINRAPVARDKAPLPDLPATLPPRPLPRFPRQAGWISAVLALVVLLGLAWVTDTFRGSSNAASASLTPTPPRSAQSSLPTTTAPKTGITEPPTVFQPTLSASPGIGLPGAGLPSPTVLSPTVLSTAFICGETKRWPLPAQVPFLPNQGVVAWTNKSTDQAVLNDKVRSILIDPRGLWIGYFATSQNAAAGVGQYDKKSWAQCDGPGGPVGQNINAMTVDHKGQLWLASEKAGVWRWDGTQWQHYSEKDRLLPTDETFGITTDSDGNVWVSTWEGIAKFDGTTWSVPYTVQGGTIANNHVHTIVFDQAKNTWVGHMGKGVSYLDGKTNHWGQYTTATSGLGGDHVHSIAVQNDKAGAPEAVWFGTSDGGVSRLAHGQWTVYRKPDGLPGNDVRTVAIDPSNRVWVATDGGVAYFDGQRWTTYDTLDTFSLAFGVPGCKTCPFDEDHVWTATAANGVTHSRIPYTEPAIDILDVRYPKVVAPGQVFRPEIVVAPRPGFTLRKDRGDALKHMDADSALRFGAYLQMSLDKNTNVVEAGQRYTFTDYDNPFVAPQLPPGQDAQTFTSTWRVWMFTRYVGPPIPITFTVRRGAPTLTPAP